MVTSHERGPAWFTLGGSYVSFLFYFLLVQVYFFHRELGGVILKCSSEEVSWVFVSFKDNLIAVKILLLCSPKSANSCNSYITMHSNTTLSGFFFLNLLLPVLHFR